MIKVMAGDYVDIFGKSHYLNTTTISKVITAAQLNSLNSATFANSTFFHGNNNETGTLKFPKSISIISF